MRVDESRKLILIALEGRVIDADLVDLSRTVRANPALAAGYGVLYDSTAVTEMLVSAELVRSLGVGARKDTNPVAFVVANPTLFGLARMYQILSDADSRIRIFHDEASALAWLESR
jgi:hypothetical protein